MVARTTIKSKVIKILSAVSNVQASKIKEKDSLTRTLLLSGPMIKALAKPYTLVSKKYGGSPITQSEAGKLKAVKASINLVHKKANTAPKPNGKRKTKKKKRKTRQRRGRRS